MNKQEAIEQVKDKALHHCGEKECYKDGCEKSIELNTALEIINQIDEPQKVKIPKFVAEWLEECKSRNLSVGQAIETVNSKEQEEIFDWFWGKGFRDNQFQFARAWLDGYEVEKEKLFVVELPSGNSRYKLLLYKGPNDEKPYFTLAETIGPNHQLPAREIKKHYEWAWQRAKPVEEE